MRERLSELDKKENDDRISRELAMDVLKASKKNVRKFQIDRALGLSDEKDKFLIAYLLAQRTLRLRIKDAQSMTDIISQLPGMLPIIPNKLVNLINMTRRSSLVWLERVSAEFIENNFAMEGGVDHVKTIKHAINDLVDKSTITDPRSIERIIVIKKETVEEWGNHWKPLIKG